MRRLTLPEREDWREQAAKVGFTFHTADGERYWDESAAFAFTLREIEEDIEAPTGELEEMALSFVGSAMKDEAILKRLAIPERFWGAIAESWTRGDRNLYGRFDFAYDGKGPAKLLEYNADTPTALFETGFFQWVWLEQQLAAGVLPEGADQFNSVHERLVEALNQLRNGARYHLHLTSVPDSPEDRGTVAYIEDCARQAGLTTTWLAIGDIGLDGEGRFVDLENRIIEVMFKLYPWEWMLREPFGEAVPQSKAQFIEPMWKAVLSNKGVLPFFWQMAPGHPNLLPAFFDDDGKAGEIGPDYVKKPIYSREGANVTLVRGGREIVTGEGPYGAEGFVIQKAVDMPDFGGGHVAIGSWVVASQPAGMLIREDSSPITGDGARFLPHFIEP